MNFKSLQNWNKFWLAHIRLSTKSLFLKQTTQMLAAGAKPLLSDRDVRCKLLPPELYAYLQWWLDLSSRLTLACTSKTHREAVAQSEVDLRGLKIQDQDLITQRDFMCFWRVIGLELRPSDIASAIGVRYSQSDTSSAYGFLPHTLVHLKVSARWSVRPKDLALQCPDLQSLELSSLCYRNTEELERLHNLKKLKIDGVRGLKSIPPYLEELVLVNARLQNLSVIRKATRLKKLHFLFHMELTDDHLSQINPRIEELSMVMCERIYKLDNLPLMPNLHTLSLGYTMINSVAALSRITSLTSLDMTLQNACELEDLSKLTGLTKLDIEGSQHVYDVSFLQCLHNLTALNLCSTEIETLKDLRHCHKLQTLEVCDCTNLASLLGLECVHTITYLDAEGCTLLVSLDHLQVSKLQKLDITRTKVKDLRPLSNAVMLRILGAGRISGVDLSPLKTCSQLEFLDIRSFNFFNLEPSSNVAMLPKITKVNL